MDNRQLLTFPQAYRFIAARAQYKISIGAKRHIVYVIGMLPERLYYSMRLQIP